MEHSKLVTFFMECGYGVEHAEVLANPLERVVEDVDKYHIFISILNDIRLSREQKDEANGRESRSEPE